MPNESLPSIGPMSRASVTSETSEPTTSPSVTCSAGGSRAKTSRRRASTRRGDWASMKVSARGSGGNSPASFANYDPDTSSWRMYGLSSLLSLTKKGQLLLQLLPPEFSETWPRAGMMRNGTAFPLPPLAPLTKETGFSPWPTPTARDGLSVSRYSLACHVKVGRARPTGVPLPERVAAELGYFLHPEFSEWLMGFPPGWTQVD